MARKGEGVSLGRVWFWSRSCSWGLGGKEDKGEVREGGKAEIMGTHK